MSDVEVRSLAELSRWLRANHKRGDGVWLITFKKNVADRYVSYGDIVDELLCWGWIDSQPKKIDGDRTALRIAPRNPKSNWSGINKAKVERLMAEGRMQKPGMALVEIAKKNGAWDFLNDVERLIVPDDLQAALDTNGEAARLFNRFPPSSRRGILEWIKTAKTPATRAKRIAETAEKAAQNIKANFPKGRDAGPPF